MHITTKQANYLGQWNERERRAAITLGLLRPPTNGWHDQAEVQHIAAAVRQLALRLRKERIN